MLSTRESFMHVSLTSRHKPAPEEWERNHKLIHCNEANYYFLPSSQYAISGLAMSQSSERSYVTFISSGEFKLSWPRKDTKKEGPPNSVNLLAISRDVKPMVRKGLLMYGVSTR